jgi:hypothetical protein
MNYVELTAAIQQYCSNSESSFVANIPNFVKTAEERIYNSVQLPVTRKVSAGIALTTGSPYLTLPTDWLATNEIAISIPSGEGGDPTVKYLVVKDVSFVRESYPKAQDKGEPDYYAQFDETTLIFGPTPDQNYGIDLHYFAYPASIVDAGTSWLGVNFNSVLLYGAIREAYLYMKGESDLIAEYEKKYQESLMLLKQLGDGKNRRDNFRNGQFRMDPQ